MSALVPSSYDPFPLVVDYDLSIEELVRRGTYHEVDPSVNSREFNLNRHGRFQVNAELLHLGRIVHTDEALREIDHRGCRPADIVETLTFGYTYKDEQRKYPIVGLGSSCEVSGYRCVPFLWSDVGRRGLSLGWIGSGWVEHYRFLVVRKSR